MGSSRPPWALLGSAETQKRHRGINPYTAESNTQPISCLINLWIFVKMGVAQDSCCVGGHVSCIGAWGAGTLHALPFCCLWLYFTLYRLVVQAVFLLLTKWTCMVSAAGRPAAGGAWWLLPEALMGWGQRITTSKSQNIRAPEHEARKINEHYS